MKFLIRAVLTAALAADCGRTVESFPIQGGPNAVGAVVNDGNGAEAAFENSLTSAPCNWRGFSGGPATAFDHNLSTSSACLGDVAAVVRIPAPASSHVLAASLKDGGHYFNCVRAIGSDGKVTAWVASPGFTVDTDPPSAPTALSAVAGFGQVLLSWNVASDTVSGVASYEVSSCPLVAPASSCQFSATPSFTGVTANSLTIPALDNCTTYEFLVAAVDGAGNLSPATATATSTPSLPPPTNLLVVSYPARAEISFTPVPGATDYEVCYSNQPAACAGHRFSTCGRTVAVLDAAHDVGVPAGNAFVAVEAIVGQTVTPNAGTLTGACTIATTPAVCTSVPTPDVGVSLMEILTVDQRVRNLYPDCTGGSFGSAVLSLELPDADSVLVAGDWSAESAGSCSLDPAGVGDFGRVTTKTGGTVVDIEGGSNRALAATLADLGDVNGDGAEDLLAGSPFDSTVAANVGSFTVFLSGDYAGAKTVDAPAGANTYFGWAIAAIGDIDADGVSDFVVTSPGAPPTAAATTQGGAYFYSGKLVTATYTQLGPAVLGPASSNLGAAVAGLGDIDSSGATVVLVGAPKYGTAGAVFAYSANPISPVPLFEQDGVSAGDGFGAMLAALGDIDGDGVNDYAVGCLHDTRVRVFSGATQQQIFVSDPTGTTTSAIAAAGDLDGDGTMDLLIGSSPGDFDGYPGSGYVSGISGSDGRMLFQVTGDPSSALGAALAFGGDPFHSGHASFLAGAPAATLGGVDGMAAQYTTDTALGIVPGEHLRPDFVSGVTATQAPVATVGGPTINLAGKGGNPGYVFKFIDQRSGASITSGNGSVSYQPGPIGNVYDVIRVTDSLQRSYDTRIYVSADSSPPPPTPARPTNLTPSLLTSTGVSLTWTAPPNPSPSQPLVNFVVEQRLLTGSWTTTATPSASATSLAVTGLRPITVYLFRIRALTQANTSVWSAPLKVVTLPSP